jgi:hypothetical protein
MTSAVCSESAFLISASEGRLAGKKGRSGETGETRETGEEFDLFRRRLPAFNGKELKWNGIEFSLVG